LLAAAIQYGILIVLFFLWYRHSAANDRRIIHVIVVRVPRISPL
jgi:hypothetical protein